MVAGGLELTSHRYSPMSDSRANAITKVEPCKLKVKHFIAFLCAKFSHLVLLDLDGDPALAVRVHDVAVGGQVGEAAQLPVVVVLAVAVGQAGLLPAQHGGT